MLPICRSKYLTRPPSRPLRRVVEVRVNPNIISLHCESERKWRQATVTSLPWRPLVSGESLDAHHHCSSLWLSKIPSIKLNSDDTIDGDRDGIHVCPIATHSRNAKLSSETHHDATPSTYIQPPPHAYTPHCHHIRTRPTTTPSWTLHCHPICKRPAAT